MDTPPTQLQTWHAMTPTQRSKEGVEEQYRTERTSYYATLYNQFTELVHKTYAEMKVLSGEYDNYLKSVTSEYEAGTTLIPEELTTCNKIDAHILKLEMLRSKISVILNTVYIELIQCKYEINLLQQQWRMASLSDSSTEAEAEFADTLYPLSNYYVGLEAVYTNFNRCYETIDRQVTTFQGLAKRRFTIEYGNGG